MSGDDTTPTSDALTPLPRNVHVGVAAGVDPALAGTFSQHHPVC